MKFWGKIAQKQAKKGKISLLLFRCIHRFWY